MALRKNAGVSPIAPLVAEFERMADSCRLLREDLTRERAERTKLVRERDQLLLQLARSGRQAESRASDTADLRELGERRRNLERERDAMTRELLALRKREADLVVELQSARQEEVTAQEERHCIEEQISQLRRALRLLTAENNLLRRKLARQT